jgi:hypothetical protein
MATLTAHFNMQKPAPDGDEDLWGEMLNSDLDIIDALLWDSVFKTTGTIQVMANQLLVPEAPLAPAGGVDLDPRRAANLSWVEYRMKAYLNQFFPIGTILMWSGLTTTIPAGWALCDGLNGTPNMAGRIVIAAHRTTAGVQPTNTGGIVSSEPFKHIHVTSTGAAPGAIPVVQGTAANPPDWGSGQPSPPYFAVCVIMKIVNF